MHNTYSLSGGTIVTPRAVRTGSALTVAGSQIATLDTKNRNDIRLSADSFVFPALINIHDHMRGNYLPKVEPKIPGSYFTTWFDWEQLLRSSSDSGERSKVSIEECYALSTYKSIFSGTVTVNDHFPHEWNEPFISRQPIRVISDYSLAHECSSYDLNWGDGIEIEHRRAVKRNVPFITHLEEGFDEESQLGVDILERLGCLDDHTVMIHCIGFSDEDIRKVRTAGASVGWCPASNIFMFNVTCKVRKLLEAGVNVSIGTDSTLSGELNQLDEMRFARKIYRQMYGEDLSAKTITEMVTINPAKAFRIDDRTGRLAPGLAADVLVLRSGETDPYEALLNATAEDLELVLHEGNPLYGDPLYEQLFAERGVRYTSVLVRGREKLVVGDPVRLLADIRNAVGYRKTLDFLPIDD